MIVQQKSQTAHTNQTVLKDRAQKRTVMLKQQKMHKIVLTVMPKKRHHKIALFANQDFVASRHMRPVIIAPQDMKESVYAKSFLLPGE
jgi:hypothetical protein